MTLFEGRRTLELYSQDIGCGFQECGDVLGKTSRLTRDDFEMAASWQVSKRCFNCKLELFHFLHRELLNSRVFDQRQLMVQCVTFNPTGDLLGKDFLNNTKKMPLPFKA